MSVLSMIRKDETDVRQTVREFPVPGSVPGSSVRLTISVNHV
jgi:hypothetical protein